jgi:hypothetical protein
LFDEGKQLTDAGQLANACARFETSLALVPQLGVALNLADCYERIGRTASAWLAFGDAVALARRADDHARWEYAQKRQVALKPRLARLTIAVSAQSLADLVVKRDGVAVRSAAYDVAVPIDPGEHVIDATASGSAWSTRVVIAHDGESISVVVPTLAPAPSLPEPDTSPPRQAAWSPGRRQPTRATWIAAGIGTASLGLGAYFGASASSLWHEASPGCDQARACSSSSFAISERSHRDADLATAMFAVAGAALATSAVLYWASPRERVQVAPVVSQRAGGLAVKMGF